MGAGLLLCLWISLGLAAAQQCFNTIPIYSAVRDTGELDIAETTNTSDADVVITPFTLVELTADEMPIAGNDGKKHYVNFNSLTFTAHSSKPVNWDGVNASQQDFTTCAIYDSSCISTFNWSFLTFKQCGDVTTAPPTASHWSDTNLADPRTAKSPATPLVIWGCNETNPPPSSYECPGNTFNMNQGWGDRGAFTQYQTTSPPVSNGGHVILFSKTVSDVSSMWFGYVFNTNRGDQVEITTWIRFQGTVPPRSSSPWGLGIKGETPDNSFLSTATAANTWYFIRYRTIASSTGSIGAGLIFDTLPKSQDILFYDLRVNIYANAAVKPVMVGTVKFSAAIINWEWCDPCKEGDSFQYGAFLDFTFSVKVRNNATINLATNNTLAHLGGQYDMYLSRYIRVNYGSEQPMPTGYPAFSNQGGTNLFTIRWWKDAPGTYSYDPIVNAIAYPPSPASSSGPPTSLVIILSVLLPFACIIYLIFAAYWWFFRRKKPEEAQPVNQGGGPASDSDARGGDEKKNNNQGDYQALPPN